MKQIALLLLYGLWVMFILLGCTHLKEQALNKDKLLAISAGSLKGMNKVDVISKFGEPLATSKSEVSECWYYTEPRSIWIWFTENRVDHWEVE